MKLRPNLAERTMPSCQVCTCPPTFDENASDRATLTGGSLIDLFSGRCGGYVKLEYITNIPRCSKMNNDPAVSIATAQKDSTKGQQQYSKSFEAGRNAIRTKRVTNSCTMCSQTSYNRQHLQAEDKFACRWCKKAFETTETLQQHMKSLHKNRNSVECPIATCSKHFLSKQIMRQHMNAIHIKKITFNCTMCSFKSYYKCSLMRHWERKHREKSSAAVSYFNYTLRLRTNNA